MFQKELERKLFVNIHALIMAEYQLFEIIN